ncbi:DUF4342 domain-containing protein [Clostridium gasigenes]|uniref:DUF4342 domain-containing protein n=1 Tax=Clostridium gasigenes TaxID=94869 RepID=UPI001C0CC912|nr:DUF4342 domain-containing protein [Clostridium gasigenes]MBU3109365.1 DUF4342 domain-containing protein [Clostridium gasigenes]
MEITLEKVDKVKERTGSSYAEAKYALEISHGEVLDAIIYIEEIKGINGVSPIIETSSKGEKGENDKNGETVEEFKVWLKDLINKGNVSRIRISKDEKELIDIPVNAGIAAGMIGIILPQVLAFGVIAAVVTKITIELTMADGSVEVVNKYISKATSEVKEKASDIAEKVKNKFNEVNLKGYKSPKSSNKADSNEESVYTYTANFEETDK